MFNKTEILKKKQRDFLFNSNLEHHKSYNKKKAFRNLKGSFGNNNYSLNTSNINAKTSSYSKIPSESSFIRKVQTHSHIKTNLFEDKDKIMNQTCNKNISKKALDINNPYYYLSLSAKLKQNSNNKIRSRSHLNTEENDINNKAYYLSGEVPFRDKYIVEIKDYNLNSNVSNKKEKSNKVINNKNEYIQCNSTDNNLKRKILNMRKKDRKIDKLAKNLSIKLNLEEKKNNNHPKCGCGNLITLNNGFFNGTNLVMSYSPIKAKNEDNKIIYNNSNNYNQTEPSFIYNNGYNFIPTNLPIFLRDKYNIKGTTVLSPFCIEARDEFLFKKIFYDEEKKRLSKRSNVIDNKLNIFYAENHAQYYKNLLKFNEKLKKKGKRIMHNIGPSPTEMKLNKLQNKMNFMKKIVDYAYPNMVLARVRETKTISKKKNLSELYLPPFKKAELFNKQRNNLFREYLAKSINIQNH